MSDQVAWLLEFEVKDGKDTELSAVMQDMVAATRNEPKTLNYEWSRSEDGTTYHIYERYADSDAVLSHLQGFGENFAERFLAAITPTRFTVYGNPNEAARDVLSGLNPTYMADAAGFAR